MGKMKYFIWITGEEEVAGLTMVGRRGRADGRKVNVAGWLACLLCMT
jgi:hypothetical protein